MNISKAFGKDWHKRIIFKLRQNDIFGNMINIFKDFVINR